MQNIVTYLLARFSEPSSYAGLGAAAALVGLHLSDTDLGTLAQFFAAGCAVAALLLKERGILPVLFLVAALMPALGACSALAPAAGAIGGISGGIALADKVSAAVDPVIQTACAEYRKGKAAADAVVATGVIPAAVAAKVGSIESFGDAACGPGSGPPAGDALSTAIWLGQLAGQVTTLTSAAAPAQGG